MTLNFAAGANIGSQLNSCPQFIFSLARVDSVGNLTVLGTAFCLDKPGLLATVAHLVGQTDEGLVIIRNSVTNIDDYQIGMRQRFQWLSVKIVQHNPVHDLAILKLDFPLDTKWPIQVGTADNVGVGTDVVSFGYPHLALRRSVLTRHHATVGAKILLPSLGNDAKFLVLNFLARPGQSGSPVFRPGSVEMVAVLTGAYVPESNGQVKFFGVDPAAINQTTHAVSAEYLRGMY